MAAAGGYIVTNANVDVDVIPLSHLATTVHAYDAYDSAYITLSFRRRVQQRTGPEVQEVRSKALRLPLRGTFLPVQVE